jgi:RES domain-containing protein
LVSRVSLEDLIIPFTGEVYRHLPVDSPYPVTDFRLAGSGDGNRWNSPGQRTLYLAIDPAVALAEWARHLQASFDPRTDPALRRHMYRLRVELSAVLDLRHPRVWEARRG